MSNTPSQRPSDSRGLTLEAEPVGGLLAMEAGDELALGAAEDYDEILPLGEDDGDGPVFGLTFGEQRDPTDEWDLGDIQELVVNETKGHFDTEGDARMDVMIMEEEFDDDEDEVVVAVWEPHADGPIQVGSRVRRKRPVVPKQYIPYGVIAALLLVLTLVSVGGFGLIALIWIFSPAEVEVAPLDRANLPKVEIERKPIEDKTADEILEEVLGEED